MEQKRGGGTKILKRGCKLGQGEGALKRGARSPLQTMYLSQCSNYLSSPLLKTLKIHTYSFLWFSNWGMLYCIKTGGKFSKIRVYSPHQALESTKIKKENMSSSVNNGIDIWPPILVFTNKHNIVPSIQICSFYILMYYWTVKIRKT